MLSCWSFIVEEIAGHGLFIIFFNIFVAPKHVTMTISEMFENNKQWIRETLEKDSGYFNNLAKGQTPELLYIGCSDSRVMPSDFLGIAPGDVFVHRNIANMVPNSDVNVQSVVNYAVKHLKVNHIAVCGHTNCGGIKAAMENNDLADLNPWLKNIRDVYRVHHDELNAISDDSKRYNRLIELNVLEQCINLFKIADVQRAYKVRNLKVHGWIFDIGTGKLIDLKIDIDKVVTDLGGIYSTS